MSGRIYTGDDEPDFYCNHCGASFDEDKVVKWEIIGHRPHCPFCFGVATQYQNVFPNKQKRKKR